MSRSHPRDIPSLLDRAVLERPDSAALGAPGRGLLSYAELGQQVSDASARLRDLGYGPESRIASVLPAGPEQAVAQLALMAATICAPMNPDLRAAELRAAFEQLRVDAVLVDRDGGEAARSAAAAARVDVVELAAAPKSRPGIFGLDARARRDAVSGAAPRAGDVALLLQTSGTTSRPKVVPLTHSNLCAAAASICDAVELSERDVCLNVMPLYHIHGLSTILSSLVVGGCVVCTPGLVAPLFFDWVDEFAPSWYTAAPAIHRAVLGAARRQRGRVQGHTFRFLRSASAPMPSSLIAEIEEMFGVPFVEAYGMTEAAPQIASNRLFASGRRAGSVGLPAGPEVAILSDDGTPLPHGETGEIAIRGDNVVSAYEDDPDATAAAFAGPWFRTGDLGRLDEGFLFVTGRVKEIINRGGEKIAPSEVDEALLRHPDVAEAVTFSLPDERLGEDVAAAVVLRDGATAREADLRRFVALNLAGFKVPARIVAVAEIPKTSTGKVRRVGLAQELGVQVLVATEDGERPASPLEELVATVWAEVLATEVVTATNFFDVGGDSLLAARIVARLREVGAAIDVVTFFEEPTVAGVARHLTYGEPPKPLPVVAAIGEEFALTPAQRSLWFLEQLRPDSALYNVSRAFRLLGPLDREALEAALDGLVARHEALRTRFFVLDGVPFQAVSPPWPTPLVLEDVASAELQSALEQACRRPVALDRSPLLRAALFRLGSEEHVLCLTTHHIVADGWSVTLLLRELEALYEGTDLDPPPAQYRQFAAWQQQSLDDELPRLLSFWKTHLAGAPERLSRWAAGADMGFGGAHLRVVYGEQLAREVSAFAAQEQTTPYVVLLAAFGLLLQRLTGSDDVLVATPAANRALRELERSVGLFSNTVVVRLPLAGAVSFREIVSRAHASAMATLAHQALPFDVLVEALSPTRVAGANPLAQVNFRYVTDREVPQLSGLASSLVGVETGSARFDLALELQADTEGLSGVFEYRTALFDDDWVAGVAESYGRLLGELLANSEDLRVLSAGPIAAGSSPGKPAFAGRRRSG